MSWASSPQTDANRGKSRIVQHLLALLGFVGLAIYSLQNSIFSCTTKFPGYLHDGTAGMVAGWWTMNHQAGLPWQQTWTTWTNAPVGEPFWRAESWTTALVVLPGWLISKLTGEICAYTVMAFLGFVLSSMSMYALVNYLTKSSIIAFLAALPYGMGYYVTEKVTIHLEYAHMWAFPLIVLSFILLFQTSRARWAIVAGMLAGSTAYTGPYMLPMAGFIVLAYSGALIFLALTRRGGGWKRARLLALSLGVWAVTVAPLIIAVAMQRARIDVPNVVRSREDLLDSGASWWAYVFPSDRNPLFANTFISRLPYEWVGGHIVESRLYLGVFSLAGFVIWVIHIIKKIKARRLSEPDLFITAFMGLLAGIAFIFAMGAELRLGSITLPLPSGVLFDYFPVWRTTARFGHIVLIPALALGSLGFAILLGILKRKWQGILLVAVLAGMAAFDVGYPRAPILPTTDFSRSPAAFTWLAKQPRAADQSVAFARPPGVPGWGTWKSWQPIHGWPMANDSGGDGMTYRQSAIDSIRDSQFPCLMSGIGAKYVLFFGGDGITSAPKGMRLAGSFRGDAQLADAKDAGQEPEATPVPSEWFNVDVLESVLPRPSKYFLAFGSGWFPSSRVWDGERELRWMTTRSAVIEIVPVKRGLDVPRRGWIKVGMDMKANQVPRRVRVVQNGVTLWNGSVPTAWVRIQFHAHGDSPLLVKADSTSPLTINFAGKDLLSTASVAVSGFGTESCA